MRNIDPIGSITGSEPQADTCQKVYARLREIAILNGDKALIANNAFVNPGIC
jgi:hypothetical protein